MLLISSFLFTFSTMNRNQMLSIPQSIHTISLMANPKKVYFVNERYFILSKCVFATCHNHKDATFLIFKCLVESCCWQRRTTRKHIAANHGVAWDHSWHKRTSTKCTFFNDSDAVRESDWSQRTRRKHPSSDCCDSFTYHNIPYLFSFWRNNFNWIMFYYRHSYLCWTILQWIIKCSSLILLLWHVFFKKRYTFLFQWFFCW